MFVDARTDAFLVEWEFMSPDRSGRELGRVPSGECHNMKHLHLSSIKVSTPDGTKPNSQPHLPGKDTFMWNRRPGLPSTSSVRRRPARLMVFIPGATRMEYRPFPGPNEWCLDRFWGQTKGVQTDYGARRKEFRLILGTHEWCSFLGPDEWSSD
jgi:hypothetical protein